MAHQLGADLVGIANIERFSKAPIKMSPQGILPTAKSVIVCAIHHPDACIQLGAETHPQDIGPYKIQYILNNKLDYMAFKLARFIEKSGYQVVPIASSNIWRYRKYDGLDAVFAPDISHIYAAVAAGLGEIGWNGLAITPEYGAWNRFVSIITDAELVPTPIYNGPKLCDMCGECIRRCPMDAYRKEVKGVNIIEFEGKQYRFANKNLWRCAWGEHFDLDLDLEIPDVVNEEVILEYTKKYGFRGGEFGQCLKYCLPPHLREKNPSYTKTYIRKRHTIATDIPVHRSVIDKMAEIADKYYLDHIGFLSKEQLESNGIRINEYLPDGKSAIVVGIEFSLPEGNLPLDRILDHNIRNDNWSRKNAIDEYHTDSIIGKYSNTITMLLNFAVLDMTVELEKLGYSAVAKTEINNEDLAKISGIYVKADGKICAYDSIITSADFPANNIKDMQKDLADREKENNETEGLKRSILDAGADLVGIASADSINKIVEQLKPFKEGEEILQVWDKNIRFAEFDPIVKKAYRKLLKPEDYITDAKSVIVIGLHYPDASAERAGKPPAEAVGPYVFAQYEVRRQLGYLAHKAVKYLNSLGYKALYSFDLMSLGSQIITPRGYFNDSVSNSLAAAAAGLGELAWNGKVYTEGLGINQCFVAVITNAELKADNIKGNSNIEKYCTSCRKCIEACPAKALSAQKKVEISIDGIKITYIPPETKRCDWSSKYALCGEDGFKYIGSKTDECPPENIDEEAIAEAIRKTDPVLKYRAVTAEKCIVECPMAAKGFKHLEV